MDMSTSMTNISNLSVISSNSIMNTSSLSSSEIGSIIPPTASSMTTCTKVGSSMVVQLKRMINQSLNHHSYTTAIFYADKLLSISQYPSEEYSENLYILCDCLYRDGQFQRSSWLLQSLISNQNHDDTNSTGTSTNPSTTNTLSSSSSSSSCSTPIKLKYIYLAAKCKIDINEWDQCMQILTLDDETMNIHYNLQEQEFDDFDQSTTKISSLICMLRGKVFDALDNLKKSKYWYIRSLKIDYRNYESFEQLVKNHVLSYSEELELISILDFSKQDKWLHDLYIISLKKYNIPSTLLNQLKDDNNNNNAEDLIPIIDCQNEQLDQLIIRGNDVQTLLAEYHFYHYQYKQAYEITKKILKKDKHYNNQICLMIHLSSMFEMQLKNELFYTCHQLIENQSQSAIAWYGIACYYHLIGNSESTQRAFTKSTTLDSKLGASWLGFGHFFASKGEHDQAMAAYRTASRLLTGLHLPLLCIGMELVRVHNLNLAEQYLLQSRDICPYDPIVYNELGVIAYKNNQFSNAIELFHNALEIGSKDSKKKNKDKSSIYNEMMEATLFNLGHCYRKTRQFTKAKHYYEIASTLSPNNASIFSALGFTHHLQGDFDTAIDYYHQSLSIYDDTFTNTLLDKALSLSILKFD
ncbi:TPR repeat-containing protein [Cavenderia fasciculata]|uniref:TPR repeat-containing protein n=1 Tax=Cavenderia fasciculata TaxID=261658 RepID=F4QD94_CACFS|nr:TPR repeat-containing protein [Cavenderia fasciculata]EGG13722.1 TPR repeat-containing protein [Cavenderia fasciculata]|eukprot:XP_004350426.1 TPR repeat-containing protein [Cavenderia fasciculata]